MSGSSGLWLPSYGTVMGPLHLQGLDVEALDPYFCPCGTGPDPSLCLIVPAGRSVELSMTADHRPSMGLSKQPILSLSVMVAILFALHREAS